MNNISILSLFVLFVISPAHARIEDPLDWVAEEDGVVFSVADDALIRFDPENLEWTVVSVPPELQRNTMEELYIYDGILWLPTDDHIANADARYYDWIVYGKEDGAPLPGYRGMSFDPDAVWIAGGRGLARMDQYTEEWTLYGAVADTVLDVEVAGTGVWLLSNDRIVRFDPVHEKTRSYRFGDEFPATDAQWLMRMGTDLLVMTTGSLVRFDTENETWRRYDVPFSLTTPKQVIASGSQWWLLFDERLLVFDTDADTFREPSWISRLAGQRFHDLTIYGGRIYLATDALLAVFEPEGDPAELKGDLYFPGQVDGLERFPLTRITSTGERLVGRGEDFIVVYVEEDDQWRMTSLPLAGAGEGIDSRLVNISDNGMEVNLPRVPSVTVKGSYIYLEQSDYRNESWEHSDRHRVRLSGQSGRVSAFFDNTDLLLGDRWGGKYKGDTEDVIREISGGWETVDPEITSLLGKTGYKGGRIWVEHGQRSEKRRRRTGVFTMEGGERTTVYAEEFFRGGESNYSLNRGKIVIGSVKMYIDDELLEEGDYTLDHSSGSFFLSFQERDLITSDSVIRVEYEYWLDESDEKSTFFVPQVVYNSGDRFSVSLGSRHEDIADSMHNLLAGGMRWRSDPDARRRLDISQEFVAAPEESEFGGHGRIAYAADRIDLTFEGVVLPLELATDARSYSEYGPIIHRYDISGRVEPLTELPVIGRGSWIETADAEGKNVSGTVLWNRALYPSFSMEMAGRWWDTDTLTTSWRKFEVGTEYTSTRLPGIRRFRLQGRFRDSREEEEQTVDYRSGLGRVEVNTGGLVDLALYGWSRRSNLDEVSLSGEDSRLTRDSYGRINLYSTRLVPWTTIYTRGEGRVGSSDFRDNEKDAHFNRSVLTSAIVRPGRLPLELEATFSRQLTDAFTGVDADASAFELLDYVGEQENSQKRRLNSIAGGPIFYMPENSSFRFRTTWSEQTSSDTSYHYSRTTSRTYRGTLDLYPRRKNRWLIEATGSESDTEQGDERWSWSVWGRWERRWSNTLLSRIVLSGNEASNNGSKSSSWGPSAYVQIGPGQRGIEVRGEIAGARRTSEFSESWQLRSTFRLEWRFLDSFLIRAEARPTLDLPDDGESSYTTVLNLKAGADF